MLLGAVHPLGGCAPTETALLTKGFIARDFFPPGPPVYCYRTLAEVDCYRTPQAAYAGRLVGSDSPLE
jgi:hypothetical protein